MQTFEYTSKENPLVVMNMDISYRFHSYLIGREGKNIERIRGKTETQIHVSKRNLKNSDVCHRDIVTISGELEKVENAISILRADLPVEIFVECKSEAIKLVKSQEHICEYMNRNFGVFVRFFSNFDGSYKVNIRGQLTNMESLNNAITYISLITGTQMKCQIIHMKYGTSFDHVWFARHNVNRIASITGASIVCTEILNYSEPPKKYSFWIYSSCIKAVYRAFNMINGLLPLQLKIKIPCCDLSDLILNIAKSKDVLLNEEQSYCDSYKKITLMSYEWNAENLFHVARLCLKLDKKPANGLIPIPDNLLFDFQMANMNRFYPFAAELIQTFSTSKLESLCSMLENIRPTLTNAELGCQKRDSEIEFLKGDKHKNYLRGNFVPASLTASRFDKNSFRLLADLLDKVNLSHYTEIFLQNEVDLAMFTTLNEQDFLAIGITSFGARKIMISLIQESRLFTEELIHSS